MYNKIFQSNNTLLYL